VLGPSGSVTGSEPLVPELGVLLDESLVIGPLHRGWRAGGAR
jgi:hypothetical protein